jgi:hypothetical protein
MRASRNRPSVRWPPALWEVWPPVSQLDIQWWSLMVGLAIFVTIVALLLVGRRIRERRGGPPDVTGEFVVNRRPVAPPAGPQTAESRGRRRPTSPPPPVSPAELASALRLSVLRITAERIPVGWSALILSPPTHPDRMTWHVHLVPEVSLDLVDGRTIAAQPPEPSHEWQLPGDRIAAVGDGDPDPPPGPETVTVRVAGPYLLVAVSRDAEDAMLLIAQVVQASGDELPRPRAAATDPRAVQGSLRQAIELTVGSRMSGAPPTVGYPLASWTSHERTWLTVSG